MSIADNVPATGGAAASAVGTAVYGLTSFPLSEIAAAISIVLSFVYLVGAMPRFLKTTRAIIAGVRSGNWRDWNKLAEQPMKEEAD
jgi:hypothetical protein